MTDAVKKALERAVKVNKMIMLKSRRQIAWMIAAIAFKIYPAIAGEIIQVAIEEMQKAMPRRPKER